jgi:hypothetical protein
MIKVIWKSAPAEEDFPAAYNYLSLMLPRKRVDRILEDFQLAPVIKRQADDILRASLLPLLPRDDRLVVHELEKMKKKERIVPILLVQAQPLIIADGYHRTCAVYYEGDEIMIHCCMVPLK